MKFYQLTPEISQRLIDADLSKYEMKLWLYLVAKDPFGDRYWQMPSVLEICTTLGMSKATYFRAKTRLQELELFDFQDQKVDCRNLTGVSKMRPGSQSNRIAPTEMRPESQKCDSKSQKCDSQESEVLLVLNSSALQTYSDLIQTNTEEEGAPQSEATKPDPFFGGNSEKEVAPQNPTSLIDKPTVQISNHQPSPGAKIPSAGENDSHSYSASQRCDEKFSRTSKNLPPYRSSWKHGDWHPEFTEFVRKRLSGTRYYFDTLRREATTGEAKIHLNKQNMTPDGKANIDVYAQEWEETKTSSKKQTIAQPVQEVEEVELAPKPQVTAPPAHILEQLRVRLQANANLKGAIAS